MQKALFCIWTWVTMSITYDGNRYATSTSTTKQTINTYSRGQS